MKIDPQRYNEHPAEDTGASGLGGGNVDPEHELIYTGKWPFGDPRNPPPENSTDNFVDTSNQLLSSGGSGSQYDNMHPFKLQFFTEEDIRQELADDDPGRDQDPDSPTFKEVIENKDETITDNGKGETKLRIYTGKLTAMINTFTYSTDIDTRNSYSLSVEECTGNMCWDVDSDEDGIDDEAFRDTAGMLVGGNPAQGGGEDPFITSTETAGGVGYEDTHTHSLHDHIHQIPDHSHFTAPYGGSGELCELEDPTEEKIDHFLTIGGQPTILGPVQIEPADFEDLTMTETYIEDGVKKEREIQTGYRAQTLDETYGKVWLVWKLDSTLPGGPIENTVRDVKIVMQVGEDDPPVDGEAEPPEGPVGALTVVGNTTKVEAKREPPEEEGAVAPTTGTYALLIGTTYDPDIDHEGDDAPAEDEPGGKNDPASPDGIKQVIYENVYYAPLILPEKY